ncbi:two-component sensor histidine kinase [Elizabethkingia anophelis]|uniref:ATP-binding protein n=1 Tax=Elizabethkingia anophelis TaxID=1117645 RepID=UPI000CE93E54|nr:ATP-binding protein [Elizabethkingia anophelis]AVF49090.1 two-component sensor histidine kinase [Elizabethkingia anophelis]AVF53086.1 two-component sensor histidine kinase [Elizabethkingia anophelis]MCT4071739.1 sensor histidine kinase [Elizabethkingia anophelis]MDV3900475.1 two-component sensor histidine kinase [Elizabethkingia anophelis]MDV4056792.1 two-component sensor histidine kinase [Elizabethkingia anophelis]
MYRLLLIFTLFICPFFVQAQDALSKLEKEYNNASDKTTEQLNIAPKYATALFFHNLKPKSYQILANNISMATKLSDGKYATILYAVQAMNYRLDNKEAESSKSLEMGKVYSLKTNSNEAKGYLEYARGWILTRNNKITDAVAAYLKAINYYENSPTTSTLYGRYGNTAKELSAIYADLNEYQLEEKYSKQFLLLASKQNDPNLIFDAYMRMGYMFEQKYVQNPSDKQFRNRAEQYYVQAITTFNKNKGSMLNKSNLSYAAINLANLYTEFNPEKAMEYAQLANKVSLETGDAIHIASSFGILAELAIQNKHYDLAKSYFLKASMEIGKSPVRNHNIELSILESLSRISEEQGNYKEALVYYKSYVDKYKSVYDQEKLDITKRLESQFEKERQEQKYIKLQLESDKKAQEIKLINILRAQREQVYNNLKLVEENQRERLKFSELESEKKEQQLRLAKLETRQKNNDINNYKKLLAFKEKINTYYTIFIVIFIVLILLLLYAYKQRAKSMKQRDELHALAMEKEKQNSKISTLTALLEGQEQERGRLARDLHDGLGGLLSGTKHQLSYLDPHQSENIEEGISKSIKQIDGAVEELRRVAHNLMPDLLVKYGLEVAIQEFASRISNNALDIHTEFINYSNSLSEEKQLIIYRIIQELVNNAIKHAEASEIIIQISQEENVLNLTVEDNGKGFDHKGLNVKKTAGFHNIESRVQFLKGTMNIISELNIGTSIELQIPIH